MSADTPSGNGCKSVLDTNVAKSEGFERHACGDAEGKPTNIIVRVDPENGSRAEKGREAAQA
jgi:hypothetical protein